MTINLRRIGRVSSPAIAYGIAWAFILSPLSEPFTASVLRVEGGALIASGAIALAGAVSLAVSLRRLGE